MLKRFTIAIGKGLFLTGHFFRQKILQSSPALSVIPAACLVAVVLCMDGCKDKYNPALVATGTNYLVVEGFINANGITGITLRRTVPLRDTARLKPELNALVTIAGDDHSSYNVRESGAGLYLSDSVTLKAGGKYRLQIKTKSGGEYFSEYLPVLRTPPIDSISWRSDNKGVQVSATTHDPQNNTRYYKWDYEETWEINSAYGNYLKYVNGSVVDRDPAEVSRLFYCWKYRNSTSIISATSAQLTSDVISAAPIKLIPPDSEEISIRYSILVRQYALDRPSYDFYQRMKSNTESLGSIFDPLPSELTGNITCVSNPAEKVVGYILASTVDQKRIFISRSEVPSRYGLFCESTYVTPDSVRYYYELVGLLPYQSDGPTNRARGYYSSFPHCIDCTLSGSNVKPTYW